MSRKTPRSINNSLNAGNKETSVGGKTIVTSPRIDPEAAQEVAETMENLELKKARGGAVIFSKSSVPSE